MDWKKKMTPRPFETRILGFNGHVFDVIKSTNAELHVRDRDALEQSKLIHQQPQNY